jgi:hypothetical protein
MTLTGRHPMRGGLYYQATKSLKLVDESMLF